MQPVPTAQVEMDKEGKLLISSTARPGRQQWQVMAQASGWTDGEGQFNKLCSRCMAASCLFCCLNTSAPPCLCTTTLALQD